MRAGLKREESSLAYLGCHFLSLARNLRARADELSARADTFNDADVRQKLQKIAATYVKLAARREQRIRDGDKV